MKPIQERFFELTSMVNVTNKKPSQILFQMRQLTEATDTDERIELSEKLWKLYFIQALPFDIQTKVKPLSQFFSVSELAVKADEIYNTLQCQMKKIEVLKKQFEYNNEHSQNDKKDSNKSKNEFRFCDNLNEQCNNNFTKKVYQEDISNNNKIDKTFFNEHLIKLKIIVLGESSVGKSCLIKRYCDDVFVDNMRATLVLDFRGKQITLDDNVINLEVWDTAGQERFSALSHTYFRGAQGAIFVYDVTNKQSFNKLNFWLEKLSECADKPNCVKMLVGNQIDKEGRKVSRNQGLRWAQQHNSLFIEASAKTNEEVNCVFEDLVEKIIKTPNLCESQYLFPKKTINLHQESKKNSTENTCC